MTTPTPEPVYYLAITNRFFYEAFGKLHIVDGLWGSRGVCNRPIFGAIETCVPEDIDHPDLCKKCKDKMPWDRVRGKEKEYL